MKTVKKKNAVLGFDRIYLDCDTAQTYEVSLGTQRLGHVSYERSGGSIFITDLFINSEVPRFRAETLILEALLSSDEIHTVSAVVPLSATDTYRSVGFVCDPSHVLMCKTK